MLAHSSQWQLVPDAARAMADVWVVARYIFLPFKLVRAVLFNISLTVAVNLFPETFFKFFFKEQDKNDLNKYMAPVARNVGNLSYIWQRMKMHWLWWVVAISYYSLDGDAVMTRNADFACGGVSDAWPWTYERSSRFTSSFHFLFISLLSLIRKAQRKITANIYT